MDSETLLLTYSQIMSTLALSWFLLRTDYRPRPRIVAIQRS